MGKSEAELSEKEIARQRDEIVRRMANTPPQPKPKPKSGASPKKRGRSGSNADAIQKEKIPK